MVNKFKINNESGVKKTMKVTDNDMLLLGRDLSPEEMRSFVFSTNAYNSGILKDISEETLQKYMASPERFNEQLKKYAMYKYITDGDIHKLVEYIRILPNLDYRIKTLGTKSKTNKYELMCRKMMRNVEHKQLTRDILTQLALTGTVVGIIMGEPNSTIQPLHCHIFDDLEYFFPARRKNGRWTIWVDLTYFDKVSDSQDRLDLIESLNPFITIDDYINYKQKGEEYRYIEIPQERSICIRANTVKRNARLGIPMITHALLGIKHKDKLRDLEKNIAGKVLRAVNVLTIGIKDSETSTYKKLGERLTRSVFENVKKGLTDESNSSPVVGLPEWAKLETTKIDTDGLDSDKMETITEDVSNSIGLPRESTYATMKLYIDIMYDRIGELLENIENEVYNKLIALILPKSVGSDYYMEYEKEYPLSQTEKLNVLQKLVSMGYAISPLLELIGLNPTEYINQSIYEIEQLELRRKIVPPLTSYTMSDNTEGTAYGEPILGGNGSDAALNENTETTNENNANDLPAANV